VCACVNSFLVCLFRFCVVFGVVLFSFVNISQSDWLRRPGPEIGCEDCLRYDLSSIVLSGIIRVGQVSHNKWCVYRRPRGVGQRRLHIVTSAGSIELPKDHTSTTDFLELNFTWQNSSQGLNFNEKRTTPVL